MKTKNDMVMKEIDGYLCWFASNKIAKETVALVENFNEEKPGKIRNEKLVGSHIWMINAERVETKDGKVIKSRDVFNIEKEESHFEDDDIKSPCANSEHNPPMHLHIPAGKKYIHICPSCGNRTVLHSISTLCDV